MEEPNIKIHGIEDSTMFPHINNYTSNNEHKRKIKGAISEERRKINTGKQITMI